MDRAVITHPPLVKELFALANEKNIPVQARRNTAGGTDAGQIQLTESGTKVAVIAVPCRYIHSPASVMSKKDYDGAYELIKHYLDVSKKGRISNEGNYPPTNRGLWAFRL